MKRFKIRLDAKRKCSYFMERNVIKEIGERTGLNVDFDKLGNLCFYGSFRPENSLFPERVLLHVMKPPSNYSEFMESSILKDNIELDFDLSGIQLLRRGARTIRIEANYPEELEKAVDRCLYRDFHFKRKGASFNILWRTTRRWDYVRKTYEVHSLSKEETDKIMDFLLDPSNPLSTCLNLPKFCLA